MGQPGCKWDSPESAEGGRLGHAGLDLSDELGLQDLRTSNYDVTDLTVKGRKAKQLEDSSGGCQVAVGVTNHSRILFTVTLNSGSADKACSIAKTLAEDAAPKLPGGK